MHTSFKSLILTSYHKIMSVKSIKSARLHRLLSIALVVCLFSSSAPAAPKVVADFASWVLVGFQIPERAFVSWLGARGLPQGQDRGMPPAPINSPGVRPRAPEARPQREARVASLVINPSGNITLESRQRVLFTAIPVDGEGNVIQGVSAEWESSNQQAVFVKKNGEAIAGRPGNAMLRVRAGQVRQTVEVTVEQGDRDEFGGRKKPDSPENGPLELTSSNRAGKAAQTTRKKRGRHHLSRTVSTAPMPLWNPNEDPLTDADSYTLYLASNAVGSPPGMRKGGALTPATATSGTEMGNQNFSFGLPVVSLPGRGIDASLALTYNSQVWHKSPNRVTFDVDSGWPAAGFRLGYGQIENQGNYGITLIDADGTRHDLKKITTNNYDSVDGTFIHYTGSVGSGTLAYPDGTRVTYGAAGGGYRGYPTKITDPNGNYILISYVSSVGPKISTIQDTLARYIRFYYASNGDLVTITQPGFTGELQAMRFYYDDVTIPTTGLFTGIGVTNPSSSTLHTLKYIYLASATETTNAHIGYKFDYSAYGMMYQVKQFRGMTASSSSTSTPGTITEGSQAAITTYNYPTTASNLSDVPTYTTRTDDWAGRTTGMAGTGNAPFYTFATSTGSGEKISTVTAPDGTIVETHSIDSIGSWNDGLVKQTVVKYSSTTLSNTVIDWEQSPSSGPPRIADVKLTDESGLTKAVVLSYTTYNNVSAVSERDFTTNGSISTTELRRTETTYVTSTNYTNRRVYHLPATVKVFPGGSSTAAARVDYAYDNYGTSHANLTARDDIIMHDPAYDPFQQTQEIECHYVCDDFDPDLGCLNWDWVCTYYNPYDATSDYRGNVTSVTTYPDATSTSGTYTHSTTYDIAGNVMTTQVDCCQQKSFTYSGAGSGGNHDYAYPISVTSGSSGTTLTTAATYDYNTGLIATSTDKNSQVTSYSYFAASLRPAIINFPDGGEIDFNYNENLLVDVAGRYHYHTTTSTKVGGSQWIDSYRFYDGRGALTQSFDNWTSADGWSTQDIEYDVMGRAYRASNPYYCGGYGWVGINPDGFWTTSSFDHLGRVTQVTMPRGDNNNSLTTNVQSTYEGIYTTVTDQAGKVRRQKVDALGRVVRLDEPTTSGLGTNTSPNQATNYTYDVIDNLVRINQGSQDRYFKYDSLSRLIRERQVEHTTNSSYDLSDSLTGNSSWTRKIDYNTSGLVSDAYDSRSVHATFTYDGLNRVTQISYSDSTPAAHYYYDSQTLPTGAPSYTHGSATGRLIGMTYGSGATGTYFGYDTMGRVNVQKQVTGSTTYGLSYSYNIAGMLTGETYPSGRALTYAYDEGGRISSMGDGTTTFANGFQYVPHGGLKSETWGNGAVHSMDYNRRLQASEVKLKQSSSGSELQRYNYSYGEVTQSSGSVDTSKNNGQIGRIDGFVNGATKEWDQRFVYDELGRLSTAAEYQQGNNSLKTWQTQYTFDRYGNRLQSGSGNSGVTYTSVTSGDINASTNRFIATGGTPTTYDAAGNITTDTKFRGMNYSYDANGRMTFAETSAHANQQTSVYDAAGQRVQTTVNSVTRSMVYDIFGQGVADYSGSNLERENIYRGGQLIATQDATTRNNVAAAGAGATASAQNYTQDGVYPGHHFQPSYAIDGLHFINPPWGDNYWRDEHGLSSWFQVDFNGSKTIDEVDVFTVADSGTYFSDPTPTETFSQYGATSFTVQYWNGSAWTTVSGGTITNNNLVWKKITFSAVTTSKVRVVVNAAVDGVARLTEVEAWGTPASGLGPINYVLSDVQGSARARMNNSGVGTSSIISRHDYLPFGEEVSSGTGLRTSTQGYGAADTNRGKYGLTERDDANGLDHTWWRKYESASGRWASPDPYRGSMSISAPQSFNRYSYTGNDPVNFIDPTGLWANMRPGEYEGDPVMYSANAGGGLMAAIRSGGFLALNGGFVAAYWWYGEGSGGWLLSFVPQDSFVYGRFGFSDGERDRLANAFERVNSKRCRKFFDETIARFRRAGEIAPRGRTTPSTLQGVLNITTLNRYNSNLTAHQVGVSQSSWAEVQGNFSNAGGGHYSGVTLADGRVFLSDNAFYQPSVMASLVYSSTDLSGVIVHEFFHRAGLTDSQIKPLHSQIQQNCGIPGFGL